MGETIVQGPWAAYALVVIQRRNAGAHPIGARLVEGFERGNDKPLRHGVKGSSKAPLSMGEELRKRVWRGERSLPDGADPALS